VYFVQQHIERLAQQHLQSMLRENIFLLALCFLILVAGLAALVLWSVRPRANERILLWFGLIAAIYGLRGLIKNPILLLTLGMAQHHRDYLVSWGDFLIVIPLTLFLEEVFGPGWRSSLRWGVWVLTLYALVGISLGVVSGKPYRLPEPAAVLLFPLFLFILLLNAIKGVPTSAIYGCKDFPDRPGNLRRICC
jgi:hypothetical protein